LRFCMLIVSYGSSGRYVMVIIFLLQTTPFSPVSNTYIKCRNKTAPQKIGPKISLPKVHITTAYAHISTLKNLSRTYLILFHVSAMLKPPTILFIYYIVGSCAKTIRRGLATEIAICKKCNLQITLTATRDRKSTRLNSSHV